MYEYAAQILSVHDGDTIHADVDLGCDTHVRLTLRLAGINAPELGGDEGVAAKVWLADDLASSGGRLVIRTTKDRREKYGRYLAELWLAIDGTWVGNAFTPTRSSVNARMVAEGHAVVYDGGKR